MACRPGDPATGSVTHPSISPPGTADALLTDGSCRRCPWIESLLTSQTKLAAGYSSEAAPARSCGHRLELKGWKSQGRAM